MGQSNNKPQSLNTRFKQALIVGDHRVLRAMISQYPYLPNKPVDDDLKSPLMFACISGQILSVKLLIEVYQVNVNEKDYNGMTALLHSVFRNTEESLEIVEFLCRSGADLTQKSDSGVTALNIAKLNRNKKLSNMLEYYLKFGKWALNPFHQRKLLLWIHNQSKYRVLPTSLIKEICLFM